MRSIQINTPLLIKQIQQKANLSECQKGQVQRFNKLQLLELYAYVNEAGRTIDELQSKLNKLNREGEVRGS